jgi:hypothetical protein
MRIIQDPCCCTSIQRFIDLDLTLWKVKSKVQVLCTRSIINVWLQVSSPSKNQLLLAHFQLHKHRDQPLAAASFTFVLGENLLNPSSFALIVMGKAPLYGLDHHERKFPHNFIFCLSFYLL